MGEIQVLEGLAKIYRQLYLNPGEGKRNHQLYKEIVLQGKIPKELKKRMEEGLTGFIGSDQDRMFIMETPVGAVRVVYLYHRKDFERFVQIIAHRCENVDIPKSMGALAVRGIINWSKIERHKKEYLANGGNFLFWDKEFKLFTEDKGNYLDDILILSRGGYSNLSPEEAGYEEEQWNELSYQIRLSHECTHFICRNKYPDKQDPVKDEVIADSMGLLETMGTYDTQLARKFLGISEDGQYKGGRLENYISDKKVTSHMVAKVNALIEQISSIIQKEQKEGKSTWNILDVIEQSDI